MLHIDPFYGSGESLIYCSTSSAAPQLRAVNEPAQRLLTQDENSIPGQVPKGVISVTRSPRERGGGGVGAFSEELFLEVPQPRNVFALLWLRRSFGLSWQLGRKKRKEKVRQWLQWWFSFKWGVSFFVFVLFFKKAPSELNYLVYLWCWAFLWNIHICVCKFESEDA